ncbi:uncharacterized protein KY384_001395 [Bacidia gigantensis]|uniref:uncharacterized protein n=1 Tax=Bacidia gigantensis TaxID=2732470 RepID=UPI001D04031F|nr:uncharacterized protein KY384_001395 [Bacidia gigantensis]KAG8533654.1 hypothetical protein KY384_001395 [Bacidia gigantensis]
MIRRSALALSRRVNGAAAAKPAANTRMFTPSLARYNATTKDDPEPAEPSKTMVAFEDVKTEHDLLPPGGKPGTIPSDLEQSTGLERFEILGKMQGVDVFDMKPLDSSRRGTIQDPLVVKSFGDEQLAGCTGSPVDSHLVVWVCMSRQRPMERCDECGSVYMMEYVGPPDDAGHGHGHGEEHGKEGGHGEEHGEEHGHGGGDDAHWLYGFKKPKHLADYVRPEYMGYPEGAMIHTMQDPPSTLSIE